MDNKGLQIGTVGGSIRFANGKITINGKDMSTLRCPCGNTKSWQYINNSGKSTKARCAVCNEESTF